jgi:signal transduction histidine kinase
VQESLTNAVRHAGASRVDIGVTERDGFVDVAVTDDGTGFDPAELPAGFGIMGMRERVKLAAGELDIQTGSTGTTVHARLPAHRL